ncbi:MAG: hypothetical protein ACI3XM_01870, partial [Eubacteriales bacterium]
SGMNCLFDGQTCGVRKGYYAVKTWGEMLMMGDACECTCDIPDIYAVSAVKDGQTLTMITYYTDDDEAVPRTFTVEMTGEDELHTLYLLDDEHDLTRSMTIAPDNGRFVLTMQPNTVVVIR